MYRPYDAFSTFAPLIIFPDLVKSAAPTRNLEYGQYANSLAKSISCYNTSNRPGDDTLPSAAASKSFDVVSRVSAIFVLDTSEDVLCGR